MARASASGAQGPGDEGRTIIVGVSSLANVMLRGLGVRAVFHLPCRFDCPGSIACAEQVIDIGRKEGFVSEMEWLGEMLHWPIEWNALHGIAEIKAPVLKCSASTDATAVLYRVLVEGSTFPEAGARGIGHAYRNPIKGTPKPLLKLDLHEAQLANRPSGSALQVLGDLGSAPSTCSRH